MQVFPAITRTEEGLVTLDVVELGRGDPRGFRVTGDQEGVVLGERWHLV